MMGWPNHPIGGGGHPVFCFFVFGFLFFKEKKVLGAFWE
jgi:hypothetical protein